MLVTGPRGATERYLESQERPNWRNQTECHLHKVSEVSRGGGEVLPRLAYTEAGERDRTGPGVEGSSLYRAEIVRKVIQSQPSDFIIKVQYLDLTRAKLLPRWLPK